MKSKINFTAIILLLSFFITCNSDMIDKGMESTEDPRRPEINVKQGDTDIYNGDTFAFIFANGVSVNEASEPQLFTIENLGTADLEIIQISIQGDNSNEFILEDPASSYIPAGTNTNFAISFAPEDTDSKTATVLIETNDFDEGEYSFIITAISKPIPFFSARLRKGTWPLTVEFKDKSSGTIDYYEWDFGDGSPVSNEAVPMHTYQEPGTYTVELKLDGPGGTNYQYITNYITVVRAEEHVFDTYANSIRTIYASYINNDSNMDLVGAVYSSHEIVWWKNDGYGNFSRFTVDNDFQTAQAVCTADIDDDGYMDIIGTQTGEIAWWENTGSNGDGTSWNKYTIDDTLAGYFYSIQAVDIDGDTNIDVIAACYNNDILRWWRNDGTPTIGAWPEYDITTTSTDYPYSIYTADIDDDTYIDILYAGNNSSGVGTIAWFENDETPLDGGWTEHTVVTDLEDVRSVCTADLDNDSNLDIIGVSRGASPYYYGQVLYWLNDGTPINGGWTEYLLNDRFLGGQHVKSIDIDADGDFDIVGAAQLSSEIFWYENPVNGSNIEWIEHLTAVQFSGVNSIDTADFNNDTNIDIAGAAKNSNEAAWWDLLQDGWWYKQSVNSSSYGARFIITSDIDNDGDMDMLGVATLANKLTWWENVDIAGPGTGIGRTWSEHSVSDDINAPIGTFAKDLDGDGYKDVLCASLDDDEITWMKNNGDGTFTDKIQIAGSFTDARFVFAEDIDGDDIPDVIGAAESDNEIAWWHNNGDETFGTKNTIDDTFTGVWSFYIEDVNGDTYPDIIGASSSIDQIAWWKNNGDGTFDTLGIPNKIIIGPFNGAKSVHAVDIDNDGDIDVAGAAQDANEISWWENTGTNGDGTSWTKHVIDNNFNTTWSVYLSDLNNDGYVDAIGSSLNLNEIAWWENNGDSTFKEKVVLINNFAGASSVYASDIDGDGDKDVLGTSYWNAEIAWVENNLVDWGP